MNLISIPVLQDNYIWILYNYKKECIIIDPGEYLKVIQTVNKLDLLPIAFLLTHHHYDHVGGLYELIKYYPVPVYGPKEANIHGVTQIVSENDKLILLDHTFIIIELPGHTLGHIGFYSPPWLFCGDTMFSAGCGRIFEGTSKQMYTSLQKINRLPNNTLICASHEYTLININFATIFLPEDKIIADYKNHIIKLRLNNESSLPSSLAIERKINVFLRCNEINFKRKLRLSSSCEDEYSIFSFLRNKRDNYQL